MRSDASSSGLAAARARSSSGRKLLVAALLLGLGADVLVWLSPTAKCPKHVAVEFLSAPSGAYRVDAIAGSVSGHCEFVLPVPEGWSASRACRGMDLRVLWGKNWGVVDQLTLPSTPDQLRLRVRRDDKVVFDELVFPRYDQDRCISKLRPSI